MKEKECFCVRKNMPCVRKKKERVLRHLTLPGGFTIREEHTICLMTQTFSSPTDGLYKKIFFAHLKISKIFETVGIHNLTHKNVQNTWRIPKKLKFVFLSLQLCILP